MRLFFLLLLALPILTLSPGALQAQEQEQGGGALNAGQTDFADAYARASRQQNMKAFWALVHPDAAACVSDAFRRLIELRDFQSLMDEPVGDDYTAQTIPVKAQEVTAYYRQHYGRKVNIPVMPRAAISFSYDKPRGPCKPRRLHSVVLVAPDDNGRWYRVLPCPEDRELDVTVEELRLKKAAGKMEYSLFSVMMPPKARQGLKKLAVDQNSPDYAASLIEKRKDVSKEMAERMIDEICINAGNDKD